MPEIVFSEAHAGDENALAEFHHFGDPYVFTHEYWCYLPEKSIFVVGKDADRIVATEAIIPYELSVCGIRMLTGRSERTLVDASYRGRNIWGQLMSYCADCATNKSMGFVWGSTGARKPFEKVGYAFLTGHRLHMYALISLRNLMSYIIKMAIKGEFNVGKIRSRIAQGRKLHLEGYVILFAALPSLFLYYGCNLPIYFQKRSFEITSEPRSYEDIDDLYERLGVRKNDIYLIQTKAFVKWMLIDSKNECLRYYAYIKDRLAGYIYVNISDPDMATIIDFAFEDKKTATALLKIVRTELGNRSSAFVKISINIRHYIQRKYIHVLIANGFIPLYRGGSEVVLPLVYNKKEILNDMSKWYLTDLWFMLYRS